MYSCTLKPNLVFSNSTRTRNDFWSSGVKVQFESRILLEGILLRTSEGRADKAITLPIQSVPLVAYIRYVCTYIVGNRRKVNALSLKICLPRMLSSPLSNHQRSVETWRTVSLGKSKGNAFIPIFSYQRLACLFVGSFHWRVHRHFGRYQTQGLSNWLSRLKVSRLNPTTRVTYFVAWFVAVTYSNTVGSSLFEFLNLKNQTIIYCNIINGCSNFWTL